MLASAIGSVRPGGTVVNVAIWGHEATVQMNELVFSEVNVIGSLAYCDDHPATRSRCCRTGRSPPSSSSPAGSGWTTWSQAGFRELIDNKEENVKILVSPKEVLS